MQAPSSILLPVICLAEEVSDGFNAGTAGGESVL